MTKRFVFIFSTLFLLCLAFFPQQNQPERFSGEITRVTYSGENMVHFPCLSDDGQNMLYILESQEGEKTKKSLRFLNLATGAEKELFVDGQEKALAPYTEIALLMGSKPPVLSGDGRVAVFCLSVDKPASIIDHYLAIVNTDGSNLWITSFPIENLSGKDLKSLGFQNNEWERISHLAVSRQGNRIACVLKGHLGPRRYGNISGIVFVDVLEKKHSFLLSPDFAENGWSWPSFPASALIGGGWAFDMDENGNSLVFGAKSSDDITDYDLYYVDWNGSEPRRLTDFHDRWFSLARMSRDGNKIVFFYNGKKQQGMGSYLVNRDGSGLTFIESRLALRVEFADISEDGRFLIFKHIYKGMMIDLLTGQEKIAFDEATPGVTMGLTPMDFPKFPSFWRPEIMSSDGDKILLAGVPEGGSSPEIYLLKIEIK